ncbi:MAG: hypothetical protein MZV70_17270 [Desulfobacterales bacterium]|nr:hypothetical protein [Desulfobacterales bacterium]
MGPAGARLGLVVYAGLGIAAGYVGLGAIKECRAGQDREGRLRPAEAGERGLPGPRHPAAVLPYYRARGLPPGGSPRAASSASTSASC